jgi:hypothetical protein
MKRLFLLLALAGVMSCGDDPSVPTGPSPGPLEIHLSGPAGVGAVLLLVEGGTIDSVEASSYFTASSAYSGVARRVLVAGPDLTGVVARIEVPDRRVSYHATILEIADGTTYQLRDPASYTATLERP